jgi:hypothetical protein
LILNDLRDYRNITERRREIWKEELPSFPCDTYNISGTMKNSKLKKASRPAPSHRAVEGVANSETGAGGIAIFGRVVYFGCPVCGGIFDHDQECPVNDLASSLSAGF